MSIINRLKKLEEIKKSSIEQKYDLSKMTDQELHRELGKVFYNELSYIKDNQMLEDINSMNETDFLDKIGNMSFNEFSDYTDSSIKYLDMSLSKEG